MTVHSERPVSCEEVSLELSELALGTLSGLERARLLRHADTCARCGAELSTLSTAVDSLQELAPEVEPPLGFELRVVERLRAETPERTRRRHLRPMHVAAALLLIAVLVSGGLALAPSKPAHSNHAPGTSLLTAQGVAAGQVLVSKGDPAWIYMTVGDDAWSGTVWCRVTLTSGRVETIGRFTLARGYGAWSAEVDAAGRQVRLAQVLDAAGKVLATATLSS